MDVCGIDPGLHVTGYAILCVSDNAPVIIRDAGICRTDTQADLPQRLHQLSQDITELLEQFPLRCVGVEQLYAHYAHPRTAILMGHARGVILAAAAHHDIEVRSYAATQVKKHLTGNGWASKVQMQRAIKATLGLTEIPEPNDVADALAIAVCCAADLKTNTSASIGVEAMR